MTPKVDCWSKYFLFAFNVIFWIVGVGLIGIGVWAWFEKGFFDNLTELSRLPVDPVLIVNGVGVMMFFLTFAGCIGSLRENIFLLKCFSFVLSVIFFGEVIVGILGFVYKGWFSAQFATFVNNTIIEYREDPDLQNIIDFAQGYFECCGGVDPDDWDNNLYFDCNKTITVNGLPFTLIESCGVPFSCCRKAESKGEVVNTQCGYGVRDKTKITTLKRGEHIYTRGCIISFEDWIKTNLYTVGGILIGLAIFQMVPICIAQNVVGDITRIKARCEIQVYHDQRPKHRRRQQHSRRAGPSSGRHLLT